MKLIFKIWTAISILFLLAVGSFAFGQNLPISGLPAATTPLSGSELAPIVQGGVTKKVAVSYFAGNGVGGVGVTPSVAWWNSANTLTYDTAFKYIDNLQRFKVGFTGYGTYIDINQFQNYMTLGDEYNDIGTNEWFKIQFYQPLYIFSNLDFQIGTPKYEFPAANGVTGRFLKDSLASGINYLKWAAVSGSGTVTSVATSFGLTGGTITTTGTIQADTVRHPKIGLPTIFYVDSLIGTVGGTDSAIHVGYGMTHSVGSTFVKLGIDTTKIIPYLDTLRSRKNPIITLNNLTAQGYKTGTVTSVATSFGLLGGTITSTGTLKIDTVRHSAIGLPTIYFIDSNIQANEGIGGSISQYQVAIGSGTNTITGGGGLTYNYSTGVFQAASSYTNITVQNGEITLAPNGVIDINGAIYSFPGSGGGVGSVLNTESVSGSTNTLQWTKLKIGNLDTVRTKTIGVPTIYWVDSSINAHSSSASLTATYIGYGNASNILIGDANFIRTERNDTLYGISLQDANYNTFIDGGNQRVTGQGNIGLGPGSLRDSLRTGNDNIGIGIGLNDLVSGNNNVAIGHPALDQMVTGNYNVAVGTLCLMDQRHSIGVTAIGGYIYSMNPSVITIDSSFGAGFHDSITASQQFSLPPYMTHFYWGGVNYTIPTTQGGATTVLTNTDGAGTLAWTSAAGAPVYTQYQIPVGDGSTPGGVTASDLMFDGENFSVGVISSTSVIQTNKDDSWVVAGDLDNDNGGAILDINHSNFGAIDFIGPSSSWSYIFPETNGTANTTMINDGIGNITFDYREPDQAYTGGSTPDDGTTVNLNVGYNAIDLSNLSLGMTFQLPTSGVDGQICEIKIVAAWTATTTASLITWTGGTKGDNYALVYNNYVKLVYNANNASWY